MDKKDLQRPIVVKRIKKAAHGHHGGAWKIAYADFVTAMMAFFLLMWLLGSTTKGDLQGIADYFRTPLKVAMQGGSGSGDSSSIVTGGGRDLTRSYGQVEMTNTPARKRTINLEAAQAEVARYDLQVLGTFKQRLEQTLEANPRMTPYRRQIMLDIVAEGLRIQIVDDQKRPMFDSGSATLKDYTREILREIGKHLNEVNYRITLSGHTDAAPYAGGAKFYSNWELSADRANASRRELIAGGLDDGKILRVQGLAASVPLVQSDPMDPSNRRISIVVMNKRAEETVGRGGLPPEADPAAAEVQGSKP